MLHDACQIRITAFCSHDFLGQVVVDKAAGIPTKPLKLVLPENEAKAASKVVKEPIGILGDGAIAFGGGAVFDKQHKDVLEKADPVQLVAR